REGEGLHGLLGVGELVAGLGGDEHQPFEVEVSAVGVGQPAVEDGGRIDTHPPVEDDVHGHLRWESGKVRGAKRQDMVQVFTGPGSTPASRSRCTSARANSLRKRWPICRSTSTYSASICGLCLPARSRAFLGEKMHKTHDNLGMPS